MSLSEWFNKLRGAFDYVTGRYECSISKGNDLAACLEIRKKIFGEELKRQGQGSSPALEDPFDANSILLACRDRETNQVIGTLRITPAHIFKGHGDYEREYHLGLFPEPLLPRVTVSTRLAVLPEYRKSAAGLSLCLASYETAVREWDAVLSVMVCEPNLYPLYRRLGFKPLTRVSRSPFGGYRLPLFILPQDYDYLRRIGSPFLKSAKNVGYPDHPEGLDWHRAYVDAHGAVDPGFSLLSEDEAENFESFITRGLGPDGKKELLNNAIRLQCRMKDCVLGMGDGSRNIGFVKKGLLEVERDGKLVAFLGEGDIFGELAFILNIPRTANVVAASPDTEVIFLSLSALKRLSDAGDREAVWRNLADLLARRLVGTRLMNPSVSL